MMNLFRYTYVGFLINSKSVNKKLKMQKSIILILGVMILSSAQLWSQKMLKQGYVKMTLTDVKSDNAEMAPMLDVMKGSTNEIHFDDKKQKVEINMMGGMMLMRVYQDIASKTSETYMDMMGQKIKTVLTKEQMDQQVETSKEMLGDAKVQYDRSDTKMILGYKCHRGTIEYAAEGQTMKMIFFVTPEIKVPQVYVQNLNGLELEGTPLAMTIDMGMMSMTYEAEEISDKLDPDFFVKPDGNYQEMTFEQLQKLGMGGQLGF